MTLSVSHAGHHPPFIASPFTTTALDFYKGHKSKRRRNKSNEPTTFSPNPEPSSLLIHLPSPLREPKAMDWYSWLSKSNLEDGLVYEYSLLFSHNELEEEDLIHFDHDFLQSMGVSIAKHRLQILKLAKKSTAKSPRLVARLLAAITKTKKSLAKYIQLLVHRDSSAIVVVPRPSYGSSARWKAAMLKRNKGLVLWKQGRLMLTDNGVKVAGENSFSHGTTPTASYNNRDSENDAEQDGFWGSAPEEIRWDAMFQDLKPT